MGNFCPDKDCDGLVLAGLCNQCGTDWNTVGINEDWEIGRMSDTRVIKVSGLSVIVREVTLGTGRLGECSLEKSEIMIDENIAEDLKAETLLHEVIHFISSCNVLDLDEGQVSVLASDLMQYLNDNK